MSRETRRFVRNIGIRAKKERGPYFQKQLRPYELQKIYFYLARMLIPAVQHA